MFSTSIKMIMRDTVKYMGLILGIAFATFLMLQQISIFLGILGRTSSQLRDIVGPDIWVMDPSVVKVDDSVPLSDTKLYQVRGAQGALWALPLNKNSGSLKVPQENIIKQVIIMGLDDASLLGQAPMVEGKADVIKQSNAVIMDRAGWKLTWPKVPFKPGKEVLINNKRFKIMALCDALPTFQTQPVIFMRYTQAKRLVPKTQKALSFILVKAKPGYKLDDVIKNIEKTTHLKALTKAQFEKSTINYFLKNTGLVINFGMTVLLGFIVGILISGLTFYIFINENLRYFATLKAIGMSHRKILEMVLSQALFVGTLGFCFGSGLCCVFFLKMGGGFSLEPFVFFMVALAVFVIITVTSILSVRRVFVLDPATVFQG